MGTPLKVTREEHTAQALRRLASDMKDAGQARRVHAISFVMDGWSRVRAAAFGCVDRQTLRDWIERYNECGVDGLDTRCSAHTARRCGGCGGLFREYLAGGECGRPVGDNMPRLSPAWLPVCGRSMGR